MGNKRCFLTLLVIFLGITVMLGGCSMGAKESVALEKYPTKPINIIVPFAAGGSMDMIARSMEKSAVKHLGQPLVVINMPGGGGTIGMNELAGAKADGYTIGVVGMGAILQPLYGQTRYHYPTALEPLIKVAASPNAVVVLSEKPWKSLGELVTYAKAHPGELKFGHSGLGAGPHLTGEILAKEAGINIVQVPFKGESEALAALLGGHVQLIVVTPSTVKDYIKSGTVRVLGVAEEKRLTIAGFENVPTFKEQGINFAFSFWQGIAAPKGLPAAEKAKLVAGLKEMVNDAAFKKDVENIGMTVEYVGPDKIGAKWAEDNAILTKLVKESGMAELIASQKK